MAVNSPWGVQYHFARFAKKTGVAETVLVNDQAVLFNYETNYKNWFWFRAQREGTKLYAKIWMHPSAEPTAWQFEVENAYNDLDLTSGNIVAACYQLRTYIDDITVRKHYPITTSKKLAITSSDGVTQFPVEIEYWDQYNKVAYLWTKVPTVWSGTNTTFYLYYDANQSDNVPYVGYTDSIVAQNVWDSNYVLVSHMNVHPSKGYVKDSTAYNVDSTAFSPDYDNWQLTQVGLSYILDKSTSDHIEFGFNNAATTITGAITVENIYKVYSGDGSYIRSISCKGLETSGRKSWAFNALNGQPYRLSAEVSSNGSAGTITATTSKFDLNVWYYGGFRYIPSTEVTLFVNNNIEVRNTSSIPSSMYSYNTDSGAMLCVGASFQLTTSYNFDGEFSEFRISKIARSDAWLKATYYTCFNQLMNFYREVAPSYYYQGYVKEKGYAVARAVKLYRRSTGALVDYTTSASGNGYYYLTTPYNEDHFVVAFDDDAGDEYNALILDRLDPTGPI
jgi:hypothetical protein